MNCNRYLSSAAVIAAMLAPLTVAAQGKERTVYHEDFDRLGDYVESFNEGASVSEWPASLKRLYFAPKTTSEARKGFFTIANPSQSKSYAVFLCFQLNSGTRSFSFEMFFGDKTSPEKRKLAIAESGSHFTEPAVYRRFPAPKDGMPGFIPPRYDAWIKGTVIVDNGKATFYTLRNGKYVADCEGTLPATPLIGWNIASSEPVTLDYVSVVENCDRPYKIGDIADWSRVFATRAAGGESEVFPKDAVVLTNKQETAFAPEMGEDLCFAYIPSKTNIWNGSNIEFISESGKKFPVSFSIAKGSKKFDCRFYNAEKKEFVNSSTNLIVSNQRICVRGPGFSRDVYVQPMLDNRYENYDVHEILANFDSLPLATDHTVHIRFRPLVSNWTTNEVWIDSKYAGTMSLQDVPSKIKANLNGNAKLCTYSVRDEMNVFADTVYLPLDVDGLDKPFGTVPAFKGMPHFQKIPYIFARPSRALNLAFCRENLGSWALECNGNLSKSPFDGMPTAMQFSVPVAQYVRVYALCAADPKAPASFEPVVTARITHYHGNGGTSTKAMCHCTRTLPAKGAPLPEGVTVFGEAEDGTPIYQVAFDFDIGSIQDITSMMNLDRLDLEFVGSLWEKDTYYLNRSTSPSYVKQSSVQIYAATLEKAAAGMVVYPNRKNSLYYPDETPGATVVVTPLSSPVSNRFNVDIEVKDAKGNVCEKQSFATMDPVQQKVSFKEKDFGFYTVSYTISGPDGKPFITHNGSFVLLPPDTRKAGYESTYYIWNFRGSHGTPSKLEDYGDMLLRMGVRRTLLPDNLPETNPEVAKYKLTHGQFPFFKPSPKNGQTKEQAIDDMKAQMRDKLAKFPHCRTAIIFHESGGHPFPKEVIDGHTEVTPEMTKADTDRANIAITTAKAWREVDPSVRLILGNSGSSIAILGQLFRAGYPKDLIDAMGDESVGMSQPPERSVAYPAWTLQKLAKSYGYDNARPDAPWEWKSRVVRHFGEELQAAFCIRSALIGHAWHFSCTPVNGLTEMANSYYDTIWGDSSFTRWPLAYPQRAAAAISTMTLLLDCAKFTRMIPTGNLTSYCLEFKKPDGSYVYTLWTANADMSVTFDGADASPVLTDMLGSNVKFNAGDSITVGQSPVYLSVKKQIKGLSAVNTVKPVLPARAGAVVAQPLASADEVQVVNGKDPRIEIGREDPPFLSFHQSGTFEAKSSEEEGGCIELTRTSTQACPELMQEYTFLKFPNAKPVAGTPNTIGLWVKGNSSWGKLYFEITDAEGEKWISAGTGGYGCSVYDWPEKASINFEGWKFVEFPITAKSPVKVYSPGENQWQWQRDGDKGNGEIDYPITVTGLGVGMYPHVLDLVEMKETSRTVLLKDLSVY